MNDLDRAIAKIRRRDWDKMRASWLDKIALVDTLSSDETFPTSDVLGVKEIWSDLNEQWFAAEREYRAALEEYDRDCEIKFAKVPKNKRDIGREAKERSNFDTNQTRLRFQKCNGKRGELPGLPETLFCEGLRLAHKAVHVLGCAEMDANWGMRSWSLSTGYHAGLFAAKAIIALCGVGIVEIEGKTMLFDVFSEPVERSDNYGPINFNYVNYRLDHKDI